MDADDLMRGPRCFAFRLPMHHRIQLSSSRQAALELLPDAMGLGISLPAALLALQDAGMPLNPKMSIGSKNLRID